MPDKLSARIGLLLWLSLLCASVQSDAQFHGSLRYPGVPEVTGDSVIRPSRMREKWNMSHSPLKATLYSALVPGAGQIYNRKYWKLPIVYGGMAACGYFIVTNTREYRKWRDSYIASVDGDPSTVPQFDPARYRLDFAQETYRRYTELSYMFLAGVYLLQVIDANVDAHLFYFDVSPDLGLHIHPSLIPTGQIRPALGISLHL